MSPALLLSGLALHFWFYRGYGGEGQHRMEWAMTSEALPDDLRPAALNAAGLAAYTRGAYDDAERWLDEGARLAAARGETWTQAHALLLHGGVAEHRGHEDDAWRMYQQALDLTRTIDDVWLLGGALANLSDAAYRRDDFAAAERFVTEALAIYRSIDNGFFVSMNLANLGQVELARGHISAAAAAYAEALAIALEIASRWNIANAIAGAAAVSAAQGDHLQAARLLGAADAEREASGHPRLPHFRRFEQTCNATHAALDDASWQASWLAGRAIPTAEAIEEAASILAAAQT